MFPYGNNGPERPHENLATSSSKIQEKFLSFLSYFHFKILNSRHFETNDWIKLAFYPKLNLYFYELCAKFQPYWSRSSRHINYLVKKTQTKWWIAGKRSVSGHMLYQHFTLYGSKHYGRVRDCCLPLGIHPGPLTPLIPAISYSQVFLQLSIQCKHSTGAVRFSRSTIRAELGNPLWWVLGVQKAPRTCC